MSHLIVEENLSFIFSESLALKEYAQGSLNPQFRNYSRKTIKKEYANYIINSTDIDTCEKVLNVLVYFNNATQTFSHVYKPTANQFFVEAVNLAGAFCEFADAAYVSYFCDFMKQKFLKYYSYIPHIYSIAFILDPRFRLASLEQCLDYYYASFFDPLPMYDEKAIDPKQQFQEWWKEKERTFPILSKMAKQVLAMSVSTVAVEQEFSAAGNVLTDYRTRLSANSLETLVCFHDWLKAKRRTQEISIEPIRHFMEETTKDGGNSD
ncbi:unnamed protein product [Cuscuta europaea]|uniref:HAT C-terminal dimerisation domain-containing protein n=1 Tax=Cuscuta europaea TaxID=41803 RepID=A0A9P0Z7U3_CUSEU|nr:unnamed protein product [Cuscuta europaea]